MSDLLKEGRKAPFNILVDTASARVTPPTQNAGLPGFLNMQKKISNIKNTILLPLKTILLCKCLPKLRKMHPHQNRETKSQLTAPRGESTFSTNGR